MKQSRFPLGQLLMTKMIGERTRNDGDFYCFMMASIARHRVGDWGDICEEDAAMNEEALKNGDRLMSVYKRMNHPDDKIWIITEADRSVTTVLFPDEY